MNEDESTDDEMLEESNKELEDVNNVRCDESESETNGEVMTVQENRHEKVAKEEKAIENETTVKGRDSL